jgi:transcriptional regulator with XRE-family HTH domain
MNNHPSLKIIGQKVKEARISKGITIRKLGALCDMDYSGLSRFENGQSNVRILTLKSIADALKVDVKDFL